MQFCKDVRNQPPSLQPDSMHSSFLHQHMQQEDDSDQCSNRRPAQTATGHCLLLFWPPVVEQSFQEHYSSTTLHLCDSINMPLDMIIWILSLLSSWRTTLGLWCTLPPLACVLGLTMLRHVSPAAYSRHRTFITVLRRLAFYPYLSLVLLHRPPHATSSWQAALIHLFVLSGSFHAACAAVVLLNHWWTALWEMAVSVLAFAAAAPVCCSNILAGSQPKAGWRAAAGFMDTAALGIYSSSLQDERLEHAVCCTTLNTALVTCSCLMVYGIHWFERQQRLRYKEQLPPAVAALQGHMYPLPPSLVISQGLLLLAHPAIVISWIAFGMWHGLMTSS